MTDYNWCHGPSCHEKETQSRVRGSGTNKVLRTRKIALNSEWIRESIYAYFCNQRCLHDYLNKHPQAIVNIAPRSKALETPIKVEMIRHSAGEDWRYSGEYIETKITKVDNA